MAKKKKQQEDATNYTFLLQCMAALTTAAIITATIIGALTIKVGLESSALATTSLMTASSVFAFIPVLAVALAALALICVLAYLSSGDNNTTLSVTPGGTNNTDTYSTAYSPGLFNQARVRTKSNGRVVHTHGQTTTRVPVGGIFEPTPPSTNVHTKPNRRMHGHGQTTTRVPVSSIFEPPPVVVTQKGNEHGHGAPGLHVHWANNF